MLHFRPGEFLVDIFDHGQNDYVTHDVVAFDDEGMPWVAWGGSLRPAKAMGVVADLRPVPVTQPAPQAPDQRDVAHGEGDAPYGEELWSAVHRLRTFATAADNVHPAPWRTGDGPTVRDDKGRIVNHVDTLAWEALADPDFGHAVAEVLELLHNDEEEELPHAVRALAKHVMRVTPDPTQAPDQRDATHGEDDATGNALRWTAVHVASCNAPVTVSAHAFAMLLDAVACGNLADIRACARVFTNLGR